MNCIEKNVNYNKKNHLIYPSLHQLKGNLGIILDMNCHLILLDLLFFDDNRFFELQILGHMDLLFFEIYAIY